MKKFLLNISSVLLFGSLLVSHSGEAAAAFSFVSDSRLASGKWVKIFTTESGIYDITFDELRAMGFENPEAVSIFGKGGAQLPSTFTNRSGTPQFTDDLSAIPVYYADDRLYFYGVGTENISFDYSGDEMPCFENGTPNLYALKGAYFLTDSEQELSLMDTFKPAGGNPVLYSNGYDYVSHEEDIYQNNTGTGQFFWGESLFYGDTDLSWKINVPHLDPSGTMLLDCRVYASKTATGTISFGIDEFESARKTYEIARATNSTFKYQKENLLFFTPDELKENLTVSLSSRNPTGVFINLDNWILSYSKLVPDFSEDRTSQQRLFIPTWTRSQGSVVLPSDTKTLVFDVTDGTKPRWLTTIEKDGLTKAVFTPIQSYNQLIFINPEERQKQISGFEPVDNNNLHALQQEKTDFLIITVPYMRKYAEQIADLHRRYDGIAVTIVEPQEVYNEFSGGIPDPMAYRGIIKMLYQSGSLKNVLFIGPNYGHFREAQKLERPEGIIAFQESVVTAERHAAHAMDFYGLTDDYIHTGSIQEDVMTVGIGLLPLTEDGNAETVVKKIENYLTRTDFADISNEFLSVGCAGDNHTHDFQAVDIADYVQEYVPGGWVSTVLCHDAYGIDGSKRKFLEDLDRGKLVTYYHGHGTSYQVPGTYDFLTGTEVIRMKNTHTGLIYLGGCDLTLTDHGRPGIGELIVTNSPHGAIGAITASRTTWSGQNFDLSKRISTALFYSSKNVLRTETPTMGEIFASAKSANSYANELCYNLIGDPAIKIPVPLYAIDATLSSDMARGGTKITVSGTVTDRDGNACPDYSGEIVLKLMAPLYEAEPANYITGKAYQSSDPDKKLLIKYVDTRMEAYRGNVENGQFSIEILLPEEISAYAGQNLPIYLSSYSSQANLAASGKTTFRALPLNKNFEGDPSAPVISAEYNNYLRVVDVTVSDNISLDRNCLSAVDEDERNLRILPLTNEDFELTRTFRIIPDVRLSGNHSMTLKAIDRFGNETIQDYTYTITDHCAPLIVEVASKAVTEEAQFFSAEPTVPLDLVIEDASGREVLKVSDYNGAYNWDLKDAAGILQTPGLYRVKIESPDDPSLFSEWQSFAILE